MHDVKAMRQPWSDHWLTATVGLLAITSFAAEYGYYCDQATDHKQPCSSFWSSEHLHDWIYNATSNWQSELFFGVLLVILLHKIKGGDA